MIRGDKNRGFTVYSEKKGKNGRRKRLGGPYPTRERAEKRLKQVESAKHRST